MVLADSHRTSRIPCYSGSSCAALDFVYRAFTFCGSSFQMILLSSTVTLWSPTTPDLPKQNRFGLFPFRSPLLRKSRLFSLPPGTEMFHFPGLAPFRVSRKRDGLPHSDICGYSTAYVSPQLFAVKPRPSSPSCAKASTVRP